MPGKIVTPEEWRNARIELLKDEKVHTQQADELAKRRAKMPVVRVDKDYTFTGPQGSIKLSDLFQGRKQLILYHAMFDPSWDGPCKSCSFLIDNMPSHLEHLQARNTSLVFVSRAPFEKLAAAKKRLSWNIDWYSSAGTDFNYDFNVTMDDNVKPVEYNFRSKADLEAKNLMHHASGEQPGFSIFVKEGDEIYHSYSCYGRGIDHLMPTYGLLDLTPQGRQDYHAKNQGLGFKYHDEY